MSRNKENNPLRQRANSSLLSLNKAPHSEDFFTDSILESSSRIPTPSPKKATFTKPRRALGSTKIAQSTHKSFGAISRPTSSLDDNFQSRPKPLQPSPNLRRRRESSPARSNELTTPPQSRDGPPLASPFSDRSSPPRALADTYQRIADEEDLAATEGELESSDEEYEASVVQDTGELTRSPEKPQDSPASRQSETSRGLTPTQDAVPDVNWNKENLISDRVESLSEASGISFLRELTDQSLAVKFTPHMIDKARHQASIQRTREDDRPIAFKYASRRSGEIPEPARHTGNENEPLEELRAFKYAGDWKTRQGNQDGFGHNRANSDTSNQPGIEAFSQARSFRREQALRDIADAESDHQPAVISDHDVLGASTGLRRSGNGQDHIMNGLTARNGLPPPKLASFSKSEGLHAGIQVMLPGARDNAAFGRSQTNGYNLATTSTSHPSPRARSSLTTNNIDSQNGFGQRSAVASGSSTGSVASHQSEPVQGGQRTWTSQEIIAKRFFQQAREKAQARRIARAQMKDLIEEVISKHNMESPAVGPDTEQRMRDMLQQELVKINEAQPATSVDLRERMKAMLEHDFPNQSQNIQQQQHQQDTADQASPASEESFVDWAAAAADVPIPSVEDSSTPERVGSTDSALESSTKHGSPDRLRKFDNDFTGMSFQVSESPPVRRNHISDTPLHKEIGSMSKHVVATNRLSELRKGRTIEPSPKKSRSPSLGLDQNSRREIVATTDDATESPAEHVPNLHAVGHRSSSRTGRREGSAHQAESPAPVRQGSRDALSRLARAVSNTPRSSPLPMDVSDDDNRLSAANIERRLNGTADAIQRPTSRQEKELANPVPQPSAPAQTPRIMGAWTDTILPDTVKTARQQDKQPKYAQTPHISAGGWIDTPLPNGRRQASSQAPMTIEEVTEELTEDVNSRKAPQLPSPPESEAASAPSKPSLPKSALTSVLDQAKQRQRIVSEDITAARDRARDDTLNLGDTTIQSLEDLLDTLDANDMTTLIHLGGEEDALVASQGRSDPEADLLERLGSKLERLRTNIHDARKGISKLEHQVSGPDGNEGQMLTSIALPPTTRRLSYTQPSSILGVPITYLPLSLPIPLLFHPRKLNQIFPRPTRLGYLTLVLWTWYLTESTMCEIYSHPTYADRYTWPSEPEPVFPYVLPTMLYRWFLRGNVLWTIFVAILRAVGMLVGWTDGFASSAGKDGAKVVASVTKNVERVVESVLPRSVGTWTEMGICDDEYI